MSVWSNQALLSSVPRSVIPRALCLLLQSITMALFSFSYSLLTGTQKRKWDRISRNCLALNMCPLSRAHNPGYSFSSLSHLIHISTTFRMERSNTKEILARVLCFAPIPQSLVCKSNYALNGLHCWSTETVKSYHCGRDQRKALCVAQHEFTDTHTLSHTLKKCSAPA